MHCEGLFDILGDSFPGYCGCSVSCVFHELRVVARNYRMFTRNEISSRTRLLGQNVISN